MRGGEDDGVPAAERLTRAELLAARLDRPMGLLGVLFLFVVLGQVLAREPWLVSTFAVLGWVFWAVFVAEFVLRAHVARWSGAFWRRNWWQLIFLALPFLRFVRALAFLRLGRVARVARLGGVLSAGVRGSRSAARLLSGRISWLAAVTAVVILASSQLYYVVDDGVRYGDALYRAALTTITGEGIEGDSPFLRVLRLALAAYSVVVFATLAGSIGAYFLQRPARGADSVSRAADLASDDPV